MTGNECNKLEDDGACDSDVDGVGIGWILEVGYVFMVVGPVEEALPR